MAILKLKNKTTGEWEEIQAIKGDRGGYMKNLFKSL